MKQVDTIKRAQIFLSENAVRENSWTRTLCQCTFDLILIAGLAWHVWITVKDWDYWQDAPNHFNIFLLLQYVILALCIRFPVTKAFKQSTVTKVSVLLGLCLLINTIIGTVWFFELTEPEHQEATAASSTTTDEK